MKKILVTGSQGFIGSYICNELLDNGYNVVGIDNYSKYIQDSVLEIGGRDYTESCSNIDPKKSFHNKSISQRSVILFAGPAANFIFSIILLIFIN